MHILVTGAAGFIGFHLCRALLAKGHSVVGLDNINSYYTTDLKFGRLAELGITRECVQENVMVQSSSYGSFRFVKCSLEDNPAMDTVFAAEKFDKVCSLAAQAGVRYSFENPSAYIQSNIEGFANIIGLSHKYGVKHFVYASSSSVYGNSNKVPFEETDRVDTPESIYAATKKSNELIANVYSSQMSLPTTGLRFFTVYGPWGRPDMAPFLFLGSILQGKKIKVFNNGNLSRDFSYIDDIVTGVVKVLEEEPKGKVYNIGNSSPVALMDFISTIEKVAGKEAIKEFAPMQQGDVYTTYASTKAMERDFGFRPNTPLLYGITQFYNWYKEFYNI